MGCDAAGFVTFVFVVAPPDVAGVFVCEVPGFAPVPSATRPAADASCEGVVGADAGVFAPGYFGLNFFLNGGADDRLMVATHVVLGYFALVGLAFVGEEVRGVALLQECVTLVFLVGEDGADRGRGPGDLAPGRGNIVTCEFAGDPGQ